VTHASIGVASAAEARDLAQRLVSFNEGVAGQENVERIMLSLKDLDGNLIGGITAARSWDTLVIDVLWVDKQVRGHHYGSLLLQQAERRGVEIGCKRAVLETFSFQAEGFYARHGYETLSKIDGWPPLGHLSRMVKVLKP